MSLFLSIVGILFAAVCLFFLLIGIVEHFSKSLANQLFVYIPVSLLALPFVVGLVWATGVAICAYPLIFISVSLLLFFVRSLASDQR
ncbi:MAG TPA: hypothetical protein VMQ76_12050 [Terracidiphilus sp.]|jgi:hypothetical protein|nr:hypothetical protein [Terracidiphilus sp.]